MKAKKKTTSNILLALLLVPILSFADTNSFLQEMDKTDVSTIYGVTTGTLVVFGDHDLDAICLVAKEHGAHVSYVATSKTDHTFQPIQAVKCNASKK